MSRDDIILKGGKKLLAVLDEAIEKGPWDKTIFLRAAGKKLREFRFRLRASLQIDDPDASKGKDLADRIADRAGQTEVYVYLYNADGQNLEKWSKLVATLRMQAVSRPVYSRENDIQELIRSKPNKNNEAYVAVYVSKEDIVTPKESSPKDKFGNDLLLLKDKAVKVENISRFMHVTGEYAFEAGQLIRKGDIQYMDFS